MKRFGPTRTCNEKFTQSAPQNSAIHTLSVAIFGTIMSNAGSTAVWERVLSSAAHLQQILPQAVLVGGTAAATHAGHRFSQDADHVITDLRTRFDQILMELESIAGWKTARAVRPAAEQLIAKYLSDRKKEPGCFFWILGDCIFT